MIGRRTLMAGLAAGVAARTAAQAQPTIRIGMLQDASGANSILGGRLSLECARQAIIEQEGAPSYLPTPLQGVLYDEAHARVVRAQRRDLYSFPAGQAVDTMTQETSVREVMLRLQNEHITAIERLMRIAEAE